MIDSRYIVNEIEQTIFRAVNAHLSGPMALKASQAAMACLYLNFKGQVVYIPNGYHMQTAARHEAIYHDFDGRNQKELAAKYRVSEKCIYQVVKKMRKKSIDQRQHQLFETEQVDDRPILIQVLQDYLPVELERSGLCPNFALAISQQISDYLIKQFPGILFVFSKQLYESKNRADNHDLFEV